MTRAVVSTEAEPRTVVGVKWEARSCKVRMWDKPCAIDAAAGIISARTAVLSDITWALGAFDAIKSGLVAVEAAVAHPSVFHQRFFCGPGVTARSGVGSVWR